MSDNEVKIGGRSWRPIHDTTFEHDVWLGVLVRRAGITVPQNSATVTAEEFEARAFFALQETGELFNFLGGLLLPADVADLKWSPEVAAQSAQFFRDLRDPDAKRDLQALLVSVVQGFFAPVLDSLQRLQVASSLLMRAPNGDGRKAAKIL